MLYLASDHAGFSLKEKLKTYFSTRKIKFVDCGPNELDPIDDYPDYVLLAAQKTAENPAVNRAIVIGGSGTGEAIAANKVKGIRAALYAGGSLDLVRLSREHNNANILALGARFLSAPQAQKAVELWLKTPFSKAARHVRRLRKIADFEK